MKCFKSCKPVAFFSLPQTQHNSYTFTNSSLQVHKSYSTNHTFRNSYAHIFETIAAVNVVQNAFTHPHQEMCSRGEMLNIRKSVREFIQWELHTCRIFSQKCLVYFSNTNTKYITTAAWICCDESQTLFFAFKRQVSRSRFCTEIFGSKVICASVEVVGGTV